MLIMYDTEKKHAANFTTCSLGIFTRLQLDFDRCQACLGIGAVVEISKGLALPKDFRHLTWTRRQCEMF